MARLATCKESALSTATVDALEHTRISGKLADVYLQFANSEPAIRGYLQMEAALREGSLSEYDLECIKLLVSEFTQCHFCLSMHTMKARKAGVDKDTQLAIRRGDTLDDKRLNAMMGIVRHLYTKPGTLEAALLDDARNNGISDTELLDITMAMSTIFFTNITNHINDTEVKLPAAPSII
ncbi:MAG: carboxymuconolactone decarboxylase family protein [Granulosicoccaceae bacterium]